MNRKKLKKKGFRQFFKTEANGLKNSDNKSQLQTVAVKMVLSQTGNVDALESLVHELKVLVHLGSHLNIVNLLGACTENISRGDLFVIYEYCPNGNLHNHLINHRADFIENQTNDLILWTFQIARGMNYLANNKVFELEF